MADGTTKPMSEIEVGDFVLAEDPETGERGPREVTHLWVHEDTIIDLAVGGHDVATTEDHPFWNHTDSEWQRADAAAEWSRAESTARLTLNTPSGVEVFEYPAAAHHEFDFTAGVEEEHFDFGLFLANVIRYDERASRLYSGGTSG